MPSDRFVLDRQIERVELRPFTLDGFHRRREQRQRNRRIASAVVALAVAAAGIGAFARTFSSDTIPASDPRSPFLGTWFSTDLDGSAQTMEIRPEREALEIEVHDESASVCSGAPSTMTGTGRLEGVGELVIPSPVLTCDDGRELEVLTPPVEEQLRNLTFIHDPEADTLSDSLGVAWDQTPGEDPGPGSARSGGLWPQTSLGEINEAQEGADAGDPRFTWQVDPKFAAEPYNAEILTRFLQEELGWKEFRGMPVLGHGGSEGSYGLLRFVRCAPGRTNPLYPNDPQGRGCAPTIDELHYETVQIDVEQLARRGPSGIWLVTRWIMPPASDADPITPFYDFAERQVEQVVPPTDAEVTGLLDAFLQARIDGEGAQEYLHSSYTRVEGIPLLYATSSGAPYERFETKRVEGPVWPLGHLVFKVRLFAEGGNTVVEETWYLYRDGDGRLGLEALGDRTTENGEVVPEPSSILDGQVTYSVSSDWTDFPSGLPNPTGYLRGGRVPGDPRRAAIIEILPNPLPPDDCYPSGDSLPSAEALVRTIRTDPDLETTSPVPARVGGIDALRLDVAAVPGAPTCVDGVPVAPSPYSEGSGVLYPRHLGRLYVLDVPEGIRVPAGSGPGEPVRTLAIWITALEADFDRDVKSAAPLLDSIEFHPK